MSAYQSYNTTILAVNLISCINFLLYLTIQEFDNDDGEDDVDEDYVPDFSDESADDDELLTGAIESVVNNSFRR